MAVEKLIRMDYLVRLPTSALEASKRDGNRIESLKKRLATAGYYMNAPYDIRPRSERLDMVDVSQVTNEFSKILNAYQDPQIAEDSDATVSAELQVLAWLKGIDKGTSADRTIAAPSFGHASLGKAIDRFEQLLIDRDGGSEFGCG